MLVFRAGFSVLEKPVFLVKEIPNLWDSRQPQKAKTLGYVLGRDVNECLLAPDRSLLGSLTGV